MSIRLYLLYMVTLCLLGGYCLEQIQLLWSSQYYQKSQRRFTVQLHYQEALNIQKGVDQLLSHSGAIFETQNPSLIQSSILVGHNSLNQFERLQAHWQSDRQSEFNPNNHSHSPYQGLNFIQRSLLMRFEQDIPPHNLSQIDVSMAEVIQLFHQTHNILTSLSPVFSAPFHASMHRKNAGQDVFISNKKSAFQKQSNALSSSLGVLIEQLAQVNQHYQSDLIQHEQKLTLFKYSSWGFYALILLVVWIWGNYSMIRPLNQLAKTSENYAFGNRFKGVRQGFQEVTKLSQSFSALANRLINQTLEDPLTGLNNRRSFDKRINDLFSDPLMLSIKNCFICFIDVDDFKLINDTYGYQVGDQALIHLANKLKTLTRSSDFSARIGGDEFALILYGYGGNEIDSVIERLKEGICQDKWFENTHKLSMTISIGAIRLDDNIPSAKQAVSAVSNACKFSKSMGKNGVYLLDYNDPRLTQEYTAQSNLQKLKDCLASESISLYAQKIMPLSQGADGAQTRYEILSRFTSPECAQISAFELVTLAETYGLAVDLDRLVLKKVFAFLRRSPESTQHFAALHINLSASSLCSESIKQYILDQLDLLPCPTDKLSFEVTETAAMKDRERAIDFIQAIRGRGCTFSLDDFGSGMCSFAYLKDFPTDYIKIDGQFVKNMENSSSDFSIVESINNVAQSLGKKTIAEYVENEALTHALASLGVDFAQGYHYQKPKPLLKALPVLSSEEAPRSVDKARSAHGAESASLV